MNLGAAGSLREGLHETLTVLRLDVPPTLAWTLRSTDENVNSGGLGGQAGSGCRFGRGNCRGSAIRSTG